MEKTRNDGTELSGTISLPESLLYRLYKNISLKNLFPLANNKNIALFYCLTIVFNCWFIAANWLFFWTRFMSFSQLGIVDAAAFAFGLLLDIPTGALADLIGKKKTLLLSTFFSFLGVMFIAPASHIFPIFLGWLITQFGWSLFSGAGEAFAFDTLKEKGLEEKYQKVISASATIGIIATVTSTFIGGFLYDINFRLPHYAWGFAYLLGFFLTFFLKEPKVIKTEKFSIKAYIDRLWNGSKTLIQPSLRRYVPLMFALLGVYYLYSYGFIQPAIATSFGFYAKGQSIIQAIIGGITALVISLIPIMRNKLSDFSGLVLLTSLLGLGFLLAALPLGYYGFFVILLIRSVGNLASPWMSIVVNKEVTSEHRATALSAVSLISKIPYILAAIIAGRMLQNGQLWLFNVIRHVVK